MVACSKGIAEIAPCSSAHRFPSARLSRSNHTKGAQRKNKIKKKQGSNRARDRFLWENGDKRFITCKRPDPFRTVIRHGGCFQLCWRCRGLARGAPKCFRMPSGEDRARDVRVRSQPPLSRESRKLCLSPGCWLLSSFFSWICNVFLAGRCTGWHRPLPGYPHNPRLWVWTC